MSAPLPDGTARPRRTRTRSRRVSAQPTLVVSTLKIHQYDLDPDCISLICPDCKTWVPIDRFQHRKHRLVPHDTGVTRRDKAARCRGSNRLVDIDVDFDTWSLKSAETTSAVAFRRATKVLPKPKAGSVPATSQLKPVPLSAEQISRAFRQHQQQCLACKGEAKDRDGQTLPCPDGERLAATVLRLLRQEPKRQAVREFVARERRRFDRQYAVAAPAKRASEWAAVLPTVQDTDTRRSQLPVGDRPTDARSVPLAPVDQKTFDRRQAELGRQYVARTATV
ncbi:hypothetical protein OG590_39985 (plasmid) [Streptomyces goshikiensis]|uniref:hypothetical protein n=1 Tax=Streptomyces goshikiensis TaxID=1942 RepID=UPI002F90BC4C|nr:hypothetical protein OG590_39985 [Streptomyces goshikiensis]